MQSFFVIVIIIIVIIIIIITIIIVVIIIESLDIFIDFKIIQKLLEDINVMVMVNFMMICIIHKILVLLKIMRILKRFLRSIDLYFLKHNFRLILCKSQIKMTCLRLKIYVINPVSN